MNRKNLPLLLMLTAGAVTCIITYVMDYSMVIRLVYLFGNILKWTLDFFEKQNQEKEEREKKENEESGNDSESDTGEQKAEENTEETDRES